MASIKEYIIDIQDYSNSSSGSKTTKSEYKFETVLKNDSDIIIRRSTSKAYKELVLIFSQGLLYLKDNKNNVTTLTADNCKRQIKTFFNGTELASVDVTGVEWVSAERITTVQSLCDFIENILSNETYINMAKNKIYISERCSQYFEELFNINKKFARILYVYFGRTLNDNIYIRASRQASYYAVNYLFFLKYGDFNIALKFLETTLLNDVVIDLNFYNTEQLVKAVNNYNLNISRLAEYLSVDLPSQGIYSINGSIIGDYIDYLRMCNELYGEIDEKYPSSFKMAHDIVAYKYKKLKEIDKNEDLLTENDDLYNNLSDYEDASFAILYPKIANDLIKEGKQLSHCVGSYVKRVKDRQSYIFFIRSKNIGLEHSYITAEILIDKNDDSLYLSQCRTFANGNVKDKAAIEFIRKWCEKKNIINTVV